MRTFAATLVITIVITLTGFAISPAVALADTPAPQYQVFFPVVFGPPPAPAPLPTPLPPTTPVTGTVQTLWPTKAVGAAGQWQDYASALNGTGNVSGNDIFSDSSYYTPKNAAYSLVNQFFFGVVYRVNRNYIEVDTTAIPADFETVQFNFTIYMPYPGPPAHHVAVYRGTWADGSLTDADGQFLTQNWGAYEPNPLAILSGGDPTALAWQPVTVTLPREVINPGGITKLVFRSTVEGTVPVTQLGGTFAGLSLTVK